MRTFSLRLSISDQFIVLFLCDFWYSEELCGTHFLIVMAGEGPGDYLITRGKDKAQITRVWESLSLERWIS